MHREKFWMLRYNELPDDFKTYFEILKSEGIRTNLYGADNYNNEYPIIVGIVQNEIENHLIVLAGDKFSTSNQVITAVDEKKKEFGRGFFGETSIKGIINFT